MNLYVGVMYMKEINYKKIGERLRKLRKYMGLTQEQVAEILGLGRDAILRIEKGDRKIDLEELMNFSKLYNISMDELDFFINNQAEFYDADGYKCTQYPNSTGAGTYDIAMGKKASGKAFYGVNGSKYLEMDLGGTIYKWQL